MKIHNTIFKALIALFVIMLGINTTAEAQSVSVNLGSLLGGGSGASKKISKKSYTTSQLEDAVEWIDEESVKAIQKYEESLPCFGFKKEHPEFKNAKIGGIGLMNDHWNSKISDGYCIRYWIVYELTDGRNIMTSSRAFRRWSTGEVTQRDDKNFEGTSSLGWTFHEVTDWVRKN